MEEDEGVPVGLPTADDNLYDVGQRRSRIFPLTCLPRTSVSEHRTFLYKWCQD